MESTHKEISRWSPSNLRESETVGSETEKPWYWQIQYWTENDVFQKVDQDSLDLILKINFRVLQQSH